MATFPSAVKTFTDRATGDTITDAFFDEPNAEITAIETFLRSSLFSTGVNSSGLPVWTSYTPVWGNTGTANTTTGSTLTGSYFQTGKLVLFKLKLTWGGGTACGSGAWTFTLPATATADGVGGLAVSMVDSSASAQYRGTTVAQSTTTVSIYNLASPIASISATVPFTWATGDSLEIRGFYDAA